MTIYAMLTVDLNGHVTSQAREVFNEVLRKHHYVKHKLTTIWTVQFVPGASPAAAENAVREHVALAARTAGISDYEALLMQGQQPATEWKSKRASTVLELGGLQGLLGMKTLLG
ncbi:hypothetical protein [Pseudomonas sp. EMN2]|uniref:hypothetical protein n=1 Tax=Pseudomonas sp. EMN2 TaxID=2615212 RepID=UPI00129A7316|nr:hypothetical protein [Pseudomonas sp. EMN2]